MVQAAAVGFQANAKEDEQATQPRRGDVHTNKNMWHLVVPGQHVTK